MTDSILEHPAIIGKLPAHGDFVARGIAYKARDAFDQWLSEWMELGRSELGDAFRPAYEAAAPWLREGERCTAILMPSTDSVGRLYPVLAVTDSDCATQEVYDCVLSALIESQSSDELRDRLGELDRSEQGERRLDWFLPDGAERNLPSPDSVAGWSAIEGELR